MTQDCPSCGSTKTRRGGSLIWMVYLVLIAAAVPAVVMFELNAGLVAAIMLTAIALAHLVLAQFVCVDCGHQWRK